MILPELENLLAAGKLKREPTTQAEFTGLVHSGEARLIDAKKPELSFESRFDLVYNASHALALAALRWHGLRSDNRYAVFQTLPHTLGLGPEVWRVLDKGHKLRNLAEYEGHLEIDGRLLEDLLRAATSLREAVVGLGPVSASGSSENGWSSHHEQQIVIVPHEETTSPRTGCPFLDGRGRFREHRVSLGGPHRPALPAF